MKNIYEDQNNNRSVEDITSGGFSFDEPELTEKPKPNPSPKKTEQPKAQSIPKGYPAVHPLRHAKAPDIRQPKKPAQPDFQQPQAPAYPNAPVEYPCAPQQPVQYPQAPDYVPQYQPVQYSPSQAMPYPPVTPRQNPPQPTVSQPVSQPPQLQFQLTNDQIAILLSQYLSTTQQYAQPAPQAKVDSQNSATNNDLGTRVLYQSPDFDKSENENTDFGSSNTSILTNRADSPFEDIDVDFSEETLPSRDSVLNSKPTKQPLNQNRVQIRSSSPVGCMSIDEIEIDSRAGTQPTKNNPVIVKPLTPTVKPIGNPILVTAPNTITSQKATTEAARASKSFSVEECESETFEEQPKTDEKSPKKISTGELVRRIILGVSVVAIVVAAGVLLNEFRLSRQNDNLESEISNLIIEEVTTTKKQTTTKNKTDKATTAAPQTTTQAPLTPAQQWEQVKSEYPGVTFPQNLQLKYARLYATNQDFVGYLSADGGNLNLPVVQADNDEVYLGKNFYGQSTKYGCPFVTHFNNIENLDLNTIIFGHHMNNKTVFGELDTYKDIEGYKAAPVISFNTLYQDYKWKIIAAFITNAEPKDDNGYVFQYYFTSLSTQECYAAFLNELAQRSLYDTGVDVLPTDKILTLSTCSHEFDDARFVVVARMVRNGESSKVDTSLAVENDNPRFPQAYYSAKKIDNPYADASKWYVE